MNMNQFLALFDTQMQDQEYDGAYRTIKQLQALGLAEVQLHLLTARLYDSTDRTAEAEDLFRLVLKSSASNAIINQARQGLQVIQDRERRKIEAQIALEMTNSAHNSSGLLLLFPIDNADKEQKAGTLARIFELDIYTARSVLPTKHMKIYRLDKYGKLKVYAQELKKNNIDSLAVNIKTIDSIPVYTVLYLEEENGGFNAVTKKKQFYIPWTSITKLIKGRVPILEEVVVGVDKKYQIAKEEQTKEYLSIVDLHCSRENIILRLEDQQYQFNQGKKFIGDHKTMMTRWKELNTWLEQMTSATIEDTFLPFAEMALLYPETLQEINPKITFPRVKECLWDNCFHLYSGIFWRQ